MGQFSLQFNRLVPKSNAPFTFADLFAGIGGFHLAGHLSGWHCTWAAEKNRTARKVYEQNFREISPEIFSNGRFLSDISDALAHDFPAVDLITAGFPCQSFSSMGKRKGFADSNGQQFWKLLEVITRYQPRAILLENVKGLLSSNKGKDFHTILSSLEKAGYIMNWQVLKASEYGLPQYRPRVFLVGFRNPSINFEFPPARPLKLTLGDIFGGKCDRMIGRTLLKSSWGERPASRFCFDAYTIDGEIRRVTSREAKKRMGLPETYSFSTVSETQAKQLVGNSVAIPVVQDVMRNIARALREEGVSLSQAA